MWVKLYNTVPSLMNNYTRTSVEITNYLDPYYKVKIIGTD